MVDNAMLMSGAYFYTGQTTQHFQYLLPAGEPGSLERGVSESLRWACTLASFLPFTRDYPNPTLYINSHVHKLRAALSDLLECAPSNHALLPWLFSVPGVVALPTERAVSFIFSFLMVITGIAKRLAYPKQSPLILSKMRIIAADVNFDVKGRFITNHLPSAKY